MNRFLVVVCFLGLSLCAVIAGEAPYRHVVLFRFKPDSPDEAVRQVEKDFAALKGKIDLIRDFEWGTNVSPEGMADGFTHCFFATFESKGDLEKYLVHPEHKKFGTTLKGLIDRVLVVDYVAKGAD
jgi:hypothetical protein